MMAKIIFAFLIAVLLFFAIDKILMMGKKTKLDLMKDNSIGFILLNCPTILNKKDSDKIMSEFNFK